MRDKYLVTYNDIIKRFQTKDQICNYLEVPLYIVNKILRKNSDKTCQEIYNEVYNNVTISLIKPSLDNLIK
jgi:hypothetical protein